MYECTAILLSVSNAERILLETCASAWMAVAHIAQTLFDLDSIVAFALHASYYRQCLRSIK